nr:hypothetical protein [Mucilaginibacter sp. SP1R1]
MFYVYTLLGVYPVALKNYIIFTIIFLLKKLNFTA